MRLPNYNNPYNKNNIELGIGYNTLADLRSIEGMIEGIGLIRRRLENTQEFFSDMQMIILNGLKDNLRTAGWGEWPALALGTIKKRRSKGTLNGAIYPSQPILNETGQMFRSIGVKRKGPRAFTIEPTGERNQRVLGYQESGTSKIPSRPLLYFSDQMIRDLYQYLVQVLDSILILDPHRSRVKKTISYNKFRGINL